MTGNNTGFNDPLPSMSNDNTTASSSELLGSIREGMMVVDSNNDELGKVASVVMGDPDAATVDASPDLDDNFGIVGNVAEALGAEGEPNVENASLRERLLRSGYIKVDGKGWFSSDRYIGVHQIAGVASDIVQLNTTKDELVSA